MFSRCSAPPFAGKLFSPPPTQTAHLRSPSLSLCRVEHIAPQPWSQLSEYEREKERQKKKKDGKSVINTKSQAVAATAVGVSWLTAGIMTGGLVVAGTMVAAGVTVGSMGGENNVKTLCCLWLADTLDPRCLKKNDFQS